MLTVQKVQQGQKVQQVLKVQEVQQVQQIQQNTPVMANVAQGYQNALQAFHLGIVNLLLHGQHWDVDYHDIIQSNLNLLHSMLQKNPDYRRRIKQLKKLLQSCATDRSPVRRPVPGPEVRTASANAGVLDWTSLDSSQIDPLYNEAQLTARLIILQPGQSLRLSCSPTIINLYRPVIGKPVVRNVADLAAPPQASWTLQRLIRQCLGNALGINRGRSADLSPRHNQARSGGQRPDRQETLLCADRAGCVLLHVVLGMPLKSTQTPTHALRADAEHHGNRPVGAGHGINQDHGIGHDLGHSAAAGSVRNIAQGHNPADSFAS